jgi:hypothetical protein
MERLTASEDLLSAAVKWLTSGKCESVDVIAFTFGTYYFLLL